MQDLKSLLDQNGYFLLTLWENPNLLKQEAFTETLRAILHLKEELLSREELTGLPDSDMAVSYLNYGVNIRGISLRYWKHQPLGCENHSIKSSVMDLPLLRSMGFIPHRLR